MADAGYDVWLVNHRGNFYSRTNLYMNPNDRDSGFWNFSWDDIGLKDYPSTFEYIRNVTEQSKLYVIAHSQGTSSLMALLSERPEFNDQLHAISLMAPVGYLNHAEFFYRLISKLEKPLQVEIWMEYANNKNDDNNIRLTFQMLRHREIFSRSNDIGMGSFCYGFGAAVCKLVLNQLFGSKPSQRNDTMATTYLSHTPAGCSTDQLLHYAQQLKYGFFGKRMTDESNGVPSNFPLYKITVPIFLHYSTIDKLADTTDVKRLISELNGTDEFYVQTIANGEFNHIDFVWGIQAAEIVYTEIIKFFAQFQ